MELIMTGWLKNWTLFVFSVVWLTVAMVGYAATDDARLTEYIRKMKKTYPDLQSMQAMIDAQHSRTNMHSGWMNPSLTVGLMNVPYPSLDLHMDPTTMLQFGLMQRIPFPGRNPLQRKAGESKMSVMRADLKVDEREMSRMVRMAYYDLAAAYATQTVLDSGVALLQEMHGATVAMTGAAMGSAADMYAVDAEIAEWTRKMDENKAVIQTRKAALAAAVGASPGDTLPVESLPVVLPPSDDLDKAINQSETGNAPKLVAAQRRINESDAALALARKNYYPDFDFMLQYGYRFKMNIPASVDMSGNPIPAGSAYQDPMVSAGITFPLPVWTKSNQRAEIGEMTAMRESAKRKYETARIEWRRDVETEHAEYNRVVKSVSALRNEIIPAREKAWRASLIGYRSSGTSLMQVSEERMKLLMAKMEERMLMAESYARFGNLLERIEP